MKIIDVLSSSNTNVKKYIYGDKNKVVEAVIYKYPDYKTRSTICISTQCGCKVGCVFCGTGKKFISNLTSAEIIEQVEKTFQNEDEKNIINSKKLQIMFMSMGEPSHNKIEVFKAIKYLNKKYPTAELLLSTIGTNKDGFLDELINLSKKISKIGLQFSIHHFDDNERNKLIPYKNKLTLKEIAKYGRLWSEVTKRQVYCNYVVTKKNNSGYERLFDLFDSTHFAFTFSVLCSPNESIKSAILNNKDSILAIHNDFLQRGYNVRIFDPAGQDDIGGGCGQLWYFQKFCKKNIDKRKILDTI